MLTQPAQPTGIAEPLVPRIQGDELHVRNAGVSLSDQVKDQNLIYFVQREKQQKQPALSAEVAQLVDMLT